MTARTSDNLARVTGLVLFALILFAAIGWPL